MHALLVLALASAPVPKVSAGPDLADRAVAVEAPIERVTVFSDRATVVRRTKVKIAGQSATVRLPDLPGNTLNGTVRVSAKGAEVWRIETTPVDRERVSIAQADEWLKKLDDLTDDLARIDARTSVIDFRIGLLSGISPASPVVEANREGRARAPLAPQVWGRSISFMSDERSKARAARRTLNAEREKKQEALGVVQAEIARLNQGGFSSRRQQVIVILGRTGNNNAALELSYTVPGASWRPGYDLRYLAHKNEVQLETSARVTQATGESWDDAELLLSTAIPGTNIAVPKLLTWTLGEAKELIPRPRPRRALPQPQVYAPPVPVESKRYRDRIQRLQLLQQRLGQIGTKYGNFGGKDTSVYDFADLDVSGELVKPQGSAKLGAGSTGRSAPQRLEREQRARKPRMRPPPSPRPTADALMSAPVAIAESDDYDEGVRSGSTARFRQSAGDSGRRQNLALFETAMPQRPRINDRTLPAALAGGFDYVYEAQTRATIPSDGREVRVPLASDRHPVKAYYEATPSLAKTAYLEAKVTNKSESPILGGPVAIFVGNQFSGDGNLATTGAGGEIELPLGADEDVKVERRIIPSTETTGFISKDDVTTYRVVLEVANHKRRPIRVGVMEPLPKTTNDDIEVELVSAKPKQTKGPDEQGLIRWDIDLAPGQKRTIELVYKIERPENWRLYQR